MPTRAFKIENLELRQLMVGDAVDCTIDDLRRDDLSGQESTLTAGAAAGATSIASAYPTLPIY